MKFTHSSTEIKSDSCELIVGENKASVHFQYIIHFYETEGEKKEQVECWEVIPSSIMVNFFAARREGAYITLPLNEFEARDPSFLNQIIATYNCHGLTLSNGRYFINSEEATKVFRDEYKECDISECEVVLFESKDGKTLEHSGKFNSQQNIVSDKQGVRPTVCNNSVAQVKLKEEYKETVEKYVKKKTGYNSDLPPASL